MHRETPEVPRLVREPCEPAIREEKRGWVNNDAYLQEKVIIVLKERNVKICQQGGIIEKTEHRPACLHTTQCLEMTGLRNKAKEREL